MCPVSTIFIHFPLLFALVFPGLKAIGCKDFAKELTAIAVFLERQDLRIWSLWGDRPIHKLCVCVSLKTNV